MQSEGETSYRKNTWWGHRGGREGGLTKSCRRCSLRMQSQSHEAIGISKNGRKIHISYMQASIGLRRRNARRGVKVPRQHQTLPSKVFNSR